MANRAEQLEQLTAYLDDELSPAERAEVERLIASDSEARQLLEELHETSHLVAALPHESAPACLADAVVSRMERRDLLEEKLGKSQKVKKSKHQEIEATGAGGSVVAAWARRFAAAASFALVCTAVWMAWSQWSGPTAERTRPIQLAQANKPQVHADKSSSGRAQGPSRQHNEISPGLAFAPSRASRSPNPAVPEARRGLASPSSTPLALGYAGDGDEEQSLAATAPAASRAPAAKTKPMKSRSTADRQIAARVLPTREASRRFVVEADGATVATLTNLIEKEMSRHAIPMLDSDSHDKPTMGQEAFFTLRRAMAASRSAGDSANRAPPEAQTMNEVRIVMYIPREVAGEIVSSIQRTTRKTETQTLPRRLLRLPAASRATEAAIRLTEDHEASEQRGSGPPVYDDALSKEDEAPAARKEKAARGGGLMGPLTTSAPHKAARVSGGEGTTSQAGVAGKEPLVTLTIILRSSGAADSQVGAPGTATRPTS